MHAVMSIYEKSEAAVPAATGDAGGVPAAAEIVVPGYDEAPSTHDRRWYYIFIYIFLKSTLQSMSIMVPFSSITAIW